jgi:hypothetical protein
VLRFRIVPDRSHVWIEAHSSLHPMASRADGLAGFVDLEVSDDGRLAARSDCDGPAGRLSLPVERLRSGNRFEDRELHRRIDAHRYPTIDGELDSLEPDREDRRYRVRGDVVFHGVRRTYESDMTAEVDGDIVHLAGGATFDVRDFGVEPPRVLVLRVEPHVAVRVHIVAEKEA